jgi:hypothetical protein
MRVVLLSAYSVTHILVFGYLFHIVRNKSCHGQGEENLRSNDLPNVRSQSLEIAVPMDRDEVRGAIRSLAGTSIEETR